jgi:uncharacterized protein YndB with AHSA1/START domain
MTAATVPPAGAHPERELVTTRRIPFPPERVLDAWTTGDRLARWWGPNGFTNAFEVFEPRPGGAWRFTMIGPDGARYPNECRFLELGPGRVVVRHLSGPAFDLVVTLAEEAGATRLTWCQRFETVEVLEKVRAFASSGNEQNLDRLEAELRRG